MSVSLGAVFDGGMRLTAAHLAPSFAMWLASDQYVYARPNSKMPKITRSTIGSTSANSTSDWPDSLLSRLTRRPFKLRLRAVILGAPVGWESRCPRLTIKAGASAPDQSALEIWSKMALTLPDSASRTAIEP